GIGTPYNANAVFMGNDASITADAINSGNGGKVVLWSDGFTSAHGTIYARGGVLAGDGGTVETSGHHILDARSIRGGVSALNGKGGNWLFDPDSNVSIDTNNTDGVLVAGIPYVPPVDPTSHIKNTDLNALLTGGATVTV